MLEPRPGADDAADGWLSVTGPAGTLLYQVQFKSRVSPGSAVASTRPDRASRPLIIAPHIPDTVADSLRRQDVHYVDATGNMYLRWAGVLLDVRGRRPERPRPAQPGQTLRLYKSSGLKVLFALLARSELVNANYRAIARAAGVSLGTVQWVLTELAETGYLRTA